LELVPRRYLDLSRRVEIIQLRVGEEATVLGRVLVAGTIRTRNQELVSIMVSDGSGVVQAVWFNRPDLKRKFHRDQEVILSGTVSIYRGKQFVNPYYEILEPKSSKARYPRPAGAVLAIYPLTEGLRLWEVRRAEYEVLKRYAGELRETLPPRVLIHHNFPPIPKAYWDLHFPESRRAGELARQRFIYEELFYYQLLLALRKRQNQARCKGFTMPEKGWLTHRFRSQLPFELTRAQSRVLKEVLADMAGSNPMNRLLQGDVGSGKTVIAIYCMLVAIENGCQAALMAPTEILAEQHWLIWREPLEALGVRVGLLTGGLRPKEKRRLSTAGAEGELQLIFGTHALIEEGVEFYRLGLAVVDEQHRFGVMQRAALLNKGLNPDFLVMTATPIPRTLALTLYGDLDISTLDEKPPGRKPVLTRLVRAKERARTDDFLKQRLSAGEQAYLVCPIIEPSAKLDLKSAVKTYKEVCQRFDGFRVGLLHGRMGSSDRLKVMEEFRAQKIQLLVTTTVVEVGVDVPRATLMLIEHPERFGLAQLHQLRGRVGRGSEKAYCFLMEPESSPVGYGEIRERLEFFTQNDDGFQLAEKDLEIRGPGELLGIRQHGLPDLKIADLKEDRRLLFLARDDLAQLLKEDPELSAPGHQMVRKALDDKFRGKVELLGVG
jgi:ATP-dependent DNA helicase RecG